MIRVRPLVAVPVAGRSVLRGMMMPVPVLILVRVAEARDTQREPGENAEHHQPCPQAAHSQQQTPISGGGKRNLPPLLALGTAAAELQRPRMPVAEPAKELRFTRAGQAAGFWIAAAVCLMAGLVFFLLTPHRAENPQLPHPAWGFVPLAFAAGLIRLAWHCTRHAYLLLSPIGVEVFPLFRPAATMQVIPWPQIDSAEIDQRRLTLHFDPEKTSGIHLSLSPIAKDRRELLAKAIRGRFPSNLQS
jgi:hypothetical protein